MPASAARQAARSIKLSVQIDNAHARADHLRALSPPGDLHRTCRDLGVMWRAALCQHEDREVLRDHLERRADVHAVCSERWVLQGMPGYQLTSRALQDAVRRLTAYFEALDGAGLSRLAHEGVLGRSMAAVTLKAITRFMNALDVEVDALCALNDLVKQASEARWPNLGDGPLRVTQEAGLEVLKPEASASSRTVKQARARQAAADLAMLLERPPSSPPTLQELRAMDFGTHRCATLLELSERVDSPLSLGQDSGWLFGRLRELLDSKRDWQQRAQALRDLVNVPAMPPGRSGAPVSADDLPPRYEDLPPPSYEDAMADSPERDMTASSDASSQGSSTSTDSWTWHKKPPVQRF